MIRRNEYKFPFSSWKEAEVRDFVSSQNMKQKYEMRMINSIYLDTKNFEGHLLGEEGIVPRDKFRLRWYGSNSFKIDQSVLEIKSAFFSHREKKSIKYNEIDSCSENNSFNKIKNQIIKKTLIPTVKVSYKRFYYENSDGIRATIDYGINYQKCVFLNNFKPLYLNAKYDQLNVLELKGDSVPATRIIMNSKINWTRFSKYSRAILNLY